MKRDKYMGMDVHQATTVVAVIDAEGKIVLETIVATAAGPIRRLIESINGPVHVTLEETTQAEWLHDLLQGFVARLLSGLFIPPGKPERYSQRSVAELVRKGAIVDRTRDNHAAHTQSGDCLCCRQRVMTAILHFALQESNHGAKDGLKRPF